MIPATKDYPTVDEVRQASIPICRWWYQNLPTAYTPEQTKVMVALCEKLLANDQFIGFDRRRIEQWVKDNKE